MNDWADDATRLEYWVDVVESLTDVDIEYYLTHNIPPSCTFNSSLVVDAIRIENCRRVLRRIQ